MKKQMLKNALITVAGAGLFFGSTVNSQALVIDATQYAGKSGTTSYSWGSMEVSSGGTTAIKTEGPYSALGINTKDSRGNDVGVTGEIDTNEYLTFNFTQAQKISDFTIDFLFANGNYGDQVNEIAFTYADINNTIKEITLKLTALSNGYSLTTYEWTGFYWATISNTATVEVISNPLNSGYGVFTIFNPFGDKLVKELTFYAGDSNKPAGVDSDYALAGINTAVPEPTTMLLFGTGILGLTALTRRKSSN